MSHGKKTTFQGSLLMYLGEKTIHQGMFDHMLTWNIQEMHAPVPCSGRMSPSARPTYWNLVRGGLPTQAGWENFVSTKTFCMPSSRASNL